MIFSAVLLVLAFPPFDFGWLGLVALIPWLESLSKTSSPRQAWWQSYLLGVLFFGGTMWWLVHVTAFGIIVLVAALALYFAVFGWIAQRFLRRAEDSLIEAGKQAAALASTWTLLEWIRGTFLTGLGWNLIGHTQWKTPLLQWAEFIGVWGVSWIVVFVNVAAWLAIKKRSKSMAIAGGILLAVLMTAGVVRQLQIDHRLQKGTDYSIGLVQGNVPQNQKWDTDFYDLIVDRYAALTRRFVGKKVDLVIWPETATPNLANDPDLQSWLAGLSREVKAPLLVGAPRAEWTPKTKLFNSAILVTAQGDARQHYDKIHLVPFGEFIPGEEWWPVIGRVRNWLPIGEFSPGKEQTVFRVPSKPPLSLSVLICFEDVFPEISREFVRRGAKVLVTITNDAWFGPTAAPIQHAQTSVFRAVENRVWMLRAGNTGYSCAISPTGRITDDLPPGTTTSKIIRIKI